MENEDGNVRISIIQKAFGEIASDLRRARDAADTLNFYTSHDSKCRTVRMAEDCTCGLSDVRKELGLEP